MLFQKPQWHHEGVAHRSRQPSPAQPSPEAVDFRRMLAWTAVATPAFIGSDLIINDDPGIGLVLLAVGAATLPRREAPGDAAEMVS